MTRADLPAAILTGFESDRTLLGRPEEEIAIHYMHQFESLKDAMVSAFS